MTEPMDEIVRQRAHSGLLKRLVRVVFAAIVLPRVARHALERAVVGERRALQSAAEAAAAWTGLFGVYYRQALFRRLLDSCGTSVHIGWMTTFATPRCRLGEGVYLGSHCSVGNAEIGDRVLIADRVQILSGGHQHRGEQASAVETEVNRFLRIRIGEGAWIGAGAIVMADVGRGAIVGAGAVVTRPVDDGDVVGGVPARSLRLPKDSTEIGPNLGAKK